MARLISNTPRDSGSHRDVSGRITAATADHAHPLAGGEVRVAAESQFAGPGLDVPATPGQNPGWDARNGNRPEPTAAVDRSIIGPGKLKGNAGPQSVGKGIQPPPSDLGLTR